jgi:hypothetical protein
VKRITSNRRNCGNASKLMKPAKSNVVKFSKAPATRARKPAVQSPSQHPEAVRSRERRASARSAGTQAPPPAVATGAQAAVGHGGGIPVPVLWLLAAVAGWLTVGAGYVLFGATAPAYGVLGGLLRGPIPLGVEMIAGEGVLWLAIYALRWSWWARGPLILVCVGIILASGKAELDAAAEAPAAAQRAHVAAVLHQQAQEAARQAGQELKTQDAAAGTGPQGKLQHEKNQGEVIGLQAKRDERARHLQEEELRQAKASAPPAEGDLLKELALLGALGSACFLPLLGMAWAASRRGKRGTP